MPVYVYRNLRTNESFEVQQRITEAALTHHPETGDPVKRLIQPVGIAFKGSGFYVNDSRSASRGSAAKGSGEASAAGDSAGDSAGGAAPKASEPAKGSEGAAKPSETPKPAAAPTSAS